MDKLDFTPAVGDAAFTPQQRSLLALAHELGRTKFAARAAQWDETASFPFANYEDLRSAGLLALAARASQPLLQRLAAVAFSFTANTVFSLLHESVHGLLLPGARANRWSSP